VNPAIPTTDRPPRRARWRPLALASLLAVGGCSKPEEITTYETPRTEPRVAAVDTGELRDALDHMFTAIVPAGDVAWFFKLVARGDAADAVRQPFIDFLATVKAEKGAEAPTWELPEGWEEGPEREMRAATILVPLVEGDLEIAVSSLPLGEDWDNFLKVNVDRWMGQLGQPELSAAKIEELSRKVDTAGGKATLLELVGTMQASPMGMAGGAMPAGHPPVGPSDPPPADDEPPAEESDPPAAASRQVAQPGGLAYETPADWKPGPPSSMRKASFVINAVGGSAEAALFVFPNVAEMADPTANGRRWAGAVGLTNVSDDEIKSAQSNVDFAGLEGQKFEFFSPERAPKSQGIIAALAVQGDQVWSIKVVGDRAAVESQRAAVDEFLASLKLPSK
jgi:hypothetical protein